MSSGQAWLLLAGAAALAAYLFLLKLRPPRILVPSLLLWRRVLDESREMTLWERIRRAVSLVVTVAIAVALAFAVTRPSRTAGATAVSRGRMLVVIDSSWSMRARTRSGETRWDRAVAEARRLAASADEVALATTADGLVEGPTTDLGLIETGLDRISPTGGDATSSWPRLAGAGIVHFITDGTLARPLDAGVVIHSVFEPAANVAITAFDVRPSLGTGAAGDAYLEIGNFAPGAQKVRVGIVRGTTSVVDREFEMAPGEILRQSMPVARGTDAVLRARVDARENSLAIDDEAFAWISRARPLSVTVVGRETGWLRALFEDDPDVRTAFVDPAAYRAGQAGREEVVIFDRWAPQDPPARPALYFAPPPDTPWLGPPPLVDKERSTSSGAASPALVDKGRSTGSGAASPAAAIDGSRAARSDGAAGLGPIEEARPRWDAPGSHPVVRGVDPFTFTIETARAYRSPALVPVARSTRGTPLVYVGESPEQRFIVVTFGPGESNLASAPGFPVLVANALEWLGRPVISAARRPELATFDQAVSTVTGPRGVSVPLVRVTGAALGMLRTPGLYVAEAGGSRSTVAVNVGDAQVSNLMRTSLSATGRARPVAAGASRRPWWIYCAIAAFLLALAEWWTWQRRITV